MYRIIKMYYGKGIYKKEDVAKFVKAGSITPDQYEMITGESFE